MRFRALVLAFVAMFAIAFNSNVLAANGPKKKLPKKQVTDAAGRQHVRPAGRITDAQRKAAAQRRKANVRRANSARANSGIKVR